MLGLLYSSLLACDLYHSTNLSVRVMYVAHKYPKLAILFTASLQSPNLSVRVMCLAHKYKELPLPDVSSDTYVKMEALILLADELYDQSCEWVSSQRSSFSVLLFNTLVTLFLIGTQ